MDTVTKVCAQCKTEKPLTEFYFRQGRPHSYCKACVTSNVYSHPPLDYQSPTHQTEVIAVEYFESFGIPVLPGKALRYSHVDIIAFGCVRIEVKTSSLLKKGHFKWTISPIQQEGGLLADLVAVICDYGNRKTFHIFPADFPVFYINGKLKTGFTFTPGAMKARKFGATRAVMTQPMMDAAQDKVQLIRDQLAVYCEILKSTHALKAA